MWEAQGEMEHLTGKLVRPKDFRPKSVIEKEKRDNEKKLKQKVRDEILGSFTVNDMDTKLYSDNVAQVSSASKSENQIAEEK